MATALEQQASQAAIVDALTNPLSAAWLSLLDVNDLEASLPRFIIGVQAIVQRYGAGSAALAAAYYEAERKSAGVPGNFTVSPASPANDAAIEQGVRWATKGLWSEEPDTEAAQTLVRGVAEKGVLDAGRSTIIDAVSADRKAKAWARVVEPGACSFCLLLATRGEVYRSEKSAGFEAHDHCRCHVEPVFNAYEPTAEIRRAQALYQQVKQHARGPVAVRRAFRQAIENDRTTPTLGG